MIKTRGLGDTPSQSQILQWIQQAAAQYGISPSLLLAQAKQESSLNPNAVSSEGAIGIMQLMPATAAGLGVDPTNVQQNIQGGAQYLAQLLTKYNGDASLALAAYNSGPGNVAKYGGIPPFAETQNYVTAILSSAGLSPGDFQPVPPRHPRPVEQAQGTQAGSTSPASQPTSPVRTPQQD